MRQNRGVGYDIISYEKVIGGVMMIINEFRGEYAFLSNFHKSPVSYKGLVYPCVENAFQAQKCADTEGKVKYTLQNNPVRAKMMGKKEKLIMESSTSLNFLARVQRDFPTSRFFLWK